MTLHLYCHPFSSFCMKTLMAFYEKQVTFESHLIDLGNVQSRAELAALWPHAKFPVFHDSVSGIVMAESSTIIEYIDLATGARLVPADPAASRGVRAWDRIIDNHLHVPMQKVVGDRLRPADAKDSHGVAEARKTLAISYDMLERVTVRGPWLFGETFTLADLAAAPPLFYAARIVPFADSHPQLWAYLGRLLERPSFRRCLDEARQYRPIFPAADTDADWPDEGHRMSF